MTEKDITFEEEGICFKADQNEVIKRTSTFYNPDMKENRDLTLLAIKSYFDQSKKISFCDPLAASGIREFRLEKKLPDYIGEMVLGDLSQEAIDKLNENIQLNKIDSSKISIKRADARETLLKGRFDYIEIDPYGTPVPFLDLALQRIKHNGMIGVTATDTATLCGVYPKTAFRRYFIKNYQTLFYPEVGLRTLITYAIKEGAKLGKLVVPLISISSKHYYKVFFRVEEQKGKAYNELRDLKYFFWDRESQEIEFRETCEKDCIGSIYVKDIYNQDFVDKMIDNLDLIEDSKNVSKILNSISNEPKGIFGYYNIHKLQRYFKIKRGSKPDKIVESLREKDFRAARVHMDNYGLRTDAKIKDIEKVLEKNN